MYSHFFLRDIVLFQTTKCFSSMIAYNVSGVSEVPEEEFGQSAEGTEPDTLCCPNPIGLERPKGAEGRGGR